MIAKIRKFSSGMIFNVILIATFFIFSSELAKSQICGPNPDFNFQTPSQLGYINWKQFPEFTLPFKVIYGGGPQFSDYQVMLKRGYTHFSNPNYLWLLPVKNRAYIYYGVAFPGKNQPWETQKNPWGNDLQVYKNHWDWNLGKMRSDTQSPDKIETDMLVFDIERQIKSNDSILLLKTSSTIPADIKALSDQNFILAYKKELQNRYAEAMKYATKELSANTSIISSYTDSPILNTFINIQGNSWEEWKTEIAETNYLTFDFANNKIGGEVYNLQTHMTPSAYFYYDYPHIFAPEYLSYLLFQCEANRAWTDKELILFVWLKYSYNKDFIHKPIKPWMAEACGIFPFFGGAKGIWLWEQTGILTEKEDLSNYEYFTKGLYRVSQYKQMFEGNYQLVEAISARDYNENKLPIWRGVYKDGKMLVAAQNPYAKSADDVVTLKMNYNNFSKEISLKGYEIYMCMYDVNLATATEKEHETLQVYPNPSEGLINLSLSNLESGILEISIKTVDGKTIYSENQQIMVKELEKTIYLEKNLNSQLLIVEILNNTKRQTKKLILK